MDVIEDAVTILRVIFDYIGIDADDLVCNTYILCNLECIIEIKDSCIVSKNHSILNKRCQLMKTGISIKILFML